jgi:nucleotide-binding universal stress UspA family protein
MATDRWKQGPPRKILLATDLSARCDRALDRALALADEWKADLVVVHVLEDEIAYPLDERHARSSWRRAPNARTQAEMRARADLLDIAPNVATVIETGDPAEAILRTARAHACDLIVTGVARNELLGRFALGTTVTRLARQSEIPILVVRKRGRPPYARIVVATDFSASSRHALDAAVHFFPGRRLTLFNAYDAPLSLMASDADSHRAQFREAAERDGRSFLKSLDLLGQPDGKPELVLEYGDPEQTLSAYVTAKNIGLVALGTHGRSAMFHALIGSVAQALIESLPCDVLVVREPLAKAEA